MSLGSIVVRLSMNTADFDTDTKRAARIAEKRAKEIDASFRKAGVAIGLALGAGLAIATRQIGLAIDRADELSKAAQKIGVTTEALSALSYAAQLADVDLGSLQAGLGRLTKFQADAAIGTEKNVRLFEALGIAFKNADGSLRNTEDVFRDFARVMAALPDSANKTALAIDVFGRSGANLIPLLNGGAQGLDDMAERAARLGIVISTDTGRAAEEFNDRLTDLNLMVMGLATSVAAELLPDLNRLVQSFQDGTESGEGFKNKAVEIADGIRMVSGIAYRAANFVQSLSWALVGMYQNAKAGANLMMGDIDAFVDASRNAEEAYRLAGENFDVASGLAPIAAPRIGTTEDKARKPAGASGAQREANAALNAYRESMGGAAAANAALAEAERERQRILDAGLAAQQALSDTISQNAANLAGPAAQAARTYADELVRLVGEEEKLRAASLLSAQAEAELAIARSQANEKYQEELEAIDKERTRIVDDMLADIAFETQLLGLNNLEREKAIALRYANVEAASAEGQAIVAALEKYDEAAKRVEGIEFMRDEVKGLFVDLTDGVGSLGDAWDKFFDNLTARVMQMLADRLFDQLFDSMAGGAASGGSGGGWASLLGSLFGGARAGGGPMSAGKAYLVGEQGPELVIPSSSAQVYTAPETRRALSGRGGDIHQHFHTPVTRDTLTQASIRTGRQQRKASAGYS